MLLSDLYQKPGHLIRRCHQISMNIFSEEMATFDLTSVQFAALTAICAHPGVDATRLSQLVAFDRSTLGDVLERLEGKGWIARAPSDRDKRSKSLHLTAAGTQLLQLVDGGVERAQERMLTGLSPVERIVFLSSMRAFIENHAEDEDRLERAASHKGVRSV